MWFLQCECAVLGKWRSFGAVGLRMPSSTPPWLLLYLPLDSHTCLTFGLCPTSNISSPSSQTGQDTNYDVSSQVRIPSFKAHQNSSYVRSSATPIPQLDAQNIARQDPLPACDSPGADFDLSYLHSELSVSFQSDVRSIPMCPYHSMVFM